MWQVEKSLAEHDTDVPAPRIAELLESASWKHALFTTYALSLSYFESEVLRPLLRVGCDDIWLISDADGYRSSLLERRSAHIGQEYRLIPAALPRGVFHGKCIYLASEDDDLLLIGSGNLTFGGHGRNAEVFEALMPSGAATAFEQFATFLEAIGSRPDILLARRDWVDEFAARARLAARRGFNDEMAPTLVHSVEEPVVDQLPTLLGGLGPCQQVTVMSPYHDPDGGAVEKLTSSMGASGGTVAVTASKESPFPFSAAATWSHPVTPVKRVKPFKRFVHAKWYEFDYQNARALLTGSINATRKALTTTDNVEIGVLRLLPPDSRPIEWVPTPEPSFEAQSQFPSGLGSHELVYASFDRAEPDRLRGQIISLQPPEGLWHLRLVTSDGDTFSHDLTVGADGRFDLQAAFLEALSQIPALQVLLIMGDRQARGWVHNDMLLGMSARRRLTAGALSRLMRREASDDDIQALLDYLSNQAEHHLRLFNLPISARSGTEGDSTAAEALITVSLDQLAPIEKIDGVARPFGITGQAVDDQFNAAMAQLRRILLGHGKQRQKAAENRSAVEREDDNPEENNTRTPEQVAESLGLMDFEDAIEDMIKNASGCPSVRDGLLSMLLEVSMAMRLYRLDDKDGAFEFLSAWFHKACRLSRADTQHKSALQQHVITAAAILYILETLVTRQSATAMELHDSLERFFEGSVDQEYARSCLVSDPHAGFAGGLLADSDDVDLNFVLTEILETRTRRQQLEDALTLALSGKAVPSDWEVFQTPLGQRLLEKLQAPHPERRVRRAPPGYRACAFDWMQFAVQEAAQFDSQRIGFCIQCKKFTVNTTP